MSKEAETPWRNWIKEKRFTLYRTSIIQEQFINCILDHCSKGETILECGFGSAVTLELLRDLEFDVYGIDLEPLSIELAKERFPHLKNKIQVGDLTDRGSYSLQPDTIIHQGVMEHFYDDEINSILSIQIKNCKRIIFDVPNNQRRVKEDEGVMTRFETPEFWERMISSTGAKFQRFGRTYDEHSHLIPKKLSHYSSDLMKKLGRSSIFVVDGELK